MPAKNWSKWESLSRKSNQLASDKLAVVASWTSAWIHDTQFIIFDGSEFCTCLYYLIPLNFAVLQPLREVKLFLVTSML
jgi:hypothetical protein